MAAAALALTATASAALEPGVFDPGATDCVTSTYSDGVLHLAKNCPTATNASARADITGLSGQTFQSASFTLVSASQCQGGSPRFNIVTTTGTFFLGCNDVTPTAPSPAGTTPGTITAAEILIDVQGTADISNITVNGMLEKPVPTAHHSAASKCKHGGWKTFTSPRFKNQGQCVSHFVHELNHAKQTANTHKHHKS